MEQTTDSIAKRIHDKADEALRQHIRKVFEPMRELMRVGSPHECQAVSTADGYPKVTIFLRTALEDMKEKAFIINAPEWRASAVCQFMDKVDSLGQEVQELRDQIGG